VDDVLFARWQMAISLGFHIVFAAIGMSMPLLMVAAEYGFLRTGDRRYYELARTWAKGTAVFFAVGAVSGTVLSFELGLLFPTFMRHAGPVVGMPFSLEGFAFFTEAIFLGIYLYGWDRLRPRAHLAAGVVVAFSGVMSAVFVTIANAWMNAPTGFRVEDGKLVDIDPIQAMRTPFAAHQVIHMVLAAYMATAIGAAAIHAWAILRHGRSELHEYALRIALTVALPATLAQPLIGHFAGQQVAAYQPMKLAAIEGLRATQSYAPLRIGPIEIPGALSLLAYNDPSAVVRGLEEFPAEDWPHGIVRVAFQVMVIIGSVLVVYALWALYLIWKKRAFSSSRRFLLATILAGPLPMLAIEAGWIVTEVGRQPWVIYGVLRTVDSATPVRGLIVPLVLFTLIYVGLAIACVAVLRFHIRKSTQREREL